MFAKLRSAGFYGVDAFPVEVEVDTAGGQQGTLIVGLPDAAVRESGERVRAALQNSGFTPHRERLIVNLAPADIRKEGPLYDLPIAIGALVATAQANSPEPTDFFIGELALNGELRPIRGAIAAAIAASKTEKARLFVPVQNANEAAVVDGVTVIAVANLRECLGMLSGNRTPLIVTTDVHALLASTVHSVDMNDVRGQSFAKRAMTIAAAGGHNVLLIGPPGSGKTMLARRLPTILPPLTVEEAIESTSIHSLAGVLKAGSALLTERPFRHPHHSVSTAALIGGGQVPSPGEVSLAHNGVLFLDELAEFPRMALEAMRQPLEDGAVTISRVGGKATIPAAFTLVAASNPCPCGHLGDFRKPCRCTQKQVFSYRSRFSGPLLDRIDLHVEVTAVKVEEMDIAPEGKDSAYFREMVLAARKIQTDRFAGLHGVTCNSRMTPAAVRQFAKLPADCRSAMSAAMDNLGLSARAYVRIIKVARTIADLRGSADIEMPDLHEAIQFRTLDRA